MFRLCATVSWILFPRVSCCNHSSLSPSYFTSVITGAMIVTMNKADLSGLGFFLAGRSTHNSRTIMLTELQTLLQYADQQNLRKEEYLYAIIEENCLGKRSRITRKISAGHLVNLYSLDPDIAIYKALLYFWRRDTQSHPLLALLCAYCRDYVLSLLVPFILQIPQGTVVSKKPIEEYLEKKKPGIFTQSTKESSVRNVIASLTKSGHLTGRANKLRSRATATPGSVSYSLFLGYLKGERGQSLFNTEYAKLLDCPVERIIELAEAASRSGWIVFRHIDNIFEVKFPARELAYE